MRTLPVFLLGTVLAIGLWGCGADTSVQRADDGATSVNGSPDVEKAPGLGDEDEDQDGGLVPPM